MQNYLLNNGIYTKVYFYPIHLKSYYREKFGYQEGDLPITERISKKIINLPMSLSFTQDDQNFIIAKLAKSDLPVNAAVCFTLMARYFKRITAHLTNIATSVILPLTDLDYFDEKRMET